MRPALVLLVLAGPALAQGPSPTLGLGPSVPALTQTSVDNLLAALKVAPNEDAAAALEAQIRALWAGAASPAVKLLLSRGAREISESAATDALASFDAALDLSPDLLEGWRGRAQARRVLGDYPGAIRDIQELLKREPRSFVALQDLSRIAEARGDWRTALAAWQKVLEISPHTAGAQTRLYDLRRRALGEQL
ncbi:MAG: hypothetical protein NVSMB18_35950 [Acetobacteraceae bacterium]